MHRPHCLIAALVVAGSVVTAAVAQTPINVPNGSFESPAIDPNTNPFLAVPTADVWDETGPGTDDEEDQNTGVFYNLSPDSGGSAANYITNADGNQLAFMSSQPGNAFYQDLTAVFTPGLSYQLTVGICVSQMFPPGADGTMHIGLYYRNDSNQRIDIIAREVARTGLSSTLLTDFVATSSVVQGSDAWVGRSIGIFLRAGADSVGGFWDLDHVRLAAVPEPAIGLVILLGLVPLGTRRRRS